jgi:hypothetical protein
MLKWAAKPQLYYQRARSARSTLGALGNAGRDCSIINARRPTLQRPTLGAGTKRERIYNGAELDGSEGLSERTDRTEIA